MQLDVKGPPYALLPSSARLTEEGWKGVIKRAAANTKPASREIRRPSRKRANSVSF